MAILAGIALIGMVSSASALTISGGPVYSLPEGGSCTVSGIATETGGATVSCTGVNVGAYTHVYFGIKNDFNVNGATMTGTAPTASSSATFAWSSNTGTSITYGSSSTITDVVSGAEAVTSELILTLTAGSGSVVATGGIPANTGNGDIERLFEITGGSSFDVLVEGNAASASLSGYATDDVYDPDRTPASGSASIHRVDLAFYYSECGDGVTDSPEQCDEGDGVNGTPGSCCTATCTFRASGEVCRVGSGDSCDTNEECTGAGATCPADDALINSGVVCRTGSGDSCDQNEVCTGVPGETCPSDDAPGNNGVVCRVGSVGGVCDQPEVCNGVPGETCPIDDAPGNLNMVCRAGSGDLCDPDELCTGVPGQGCPADQVAPPTTVCRAGSGDSCDPDELCTAIPGQACPGDVVQSAGTVCRAAANDCDLEEQCSGSALDTCPSDVFASAGASCDLDSDVCTVDECDGSGTCLFDSNLDCDDGSTCTQDSCDAVSGCEFDGSPSGLCTSPVKAVFKYNNKTINKGDKVTFVWKGGPALVNDMGDPTQTTDYELCVYDDNGVQLAMTVPAGAGWSPIGKPTEPKGYKYKDKNSVNDGVKRIIVKGSNLDKARSKLVAKGNNLPDTATLPFLFPVTAQLYASDGMCWEAQFDTLTHKKNEVDKFIGKVP